MGNVPKDLKRLLLGLALAGCSTVDSRIKEQSAVFQGLAPDAQQRIRQGQVAVGDTPDMVYMALGSADERQTKRDAQTSEETWIYRVYYQVYAGRQFVGYRRNVITDTRTGQRIVYFEPDYADLYRDQAEDRIRIVFRAGRVAVIEQRQR